MVTSGETPAEGEKVAEKVAEAEIAHDSMPTAAQRSDSEEEDDDDDDRASHKSVTITPSKRSRVAMPKQLAQSDKTTPPHNSLSDKAAAKKKVVPKAKAGKIQCRGCRLKRPVELYFPNDVYDKVCKRALSRIKAQVDKQGEDAQRLYTEALGDVNMVHAMLTNYFEHCGGMPKEDERVKKGTGGSWRITTFTETYRASNEVVLERMGDMMWEELYLACAKQEYEGLTRVQAQAQWGQWEAMHERLDKNAPLTRNCGPNSEKCFWVPELVRVGFRDVISRDKAVTTVTQKPIKNASDIELGKLRQEAQSGLEDISGGALFGDVGSDAQNLLSGTGLGSGSDGITASAFAGEFGTRVPDIQQIIKPPVAKPLVKDSDDDEVDEISSRWQRQMTMTRRSWHGIAIQM